jgi:hypothetical protein
MFIGMGVPMRWHYDTAVGALCLFVAGCATPYQEMGLLGGVTAAQIDSTTVRVSAKGNGYTDTATIQNYVLLKSAEVTRSNGLDLFMVMNAANTSRSGSVSYSSASVFGGYNSAWGFGSAFSEEIIKPGEDAIIKMMRGPKPANAPPNVFDANEVLFFLSKSVKGYKPPPGLLIPAAYTPPTPPTSAQILEAQKAEQAAAPRSVCTHQQQVEARIARENGYTSGPKCD